MGSVTNLIPYWLAIALIILTDLHSNGFAQIKQAYPKDMEFCCDSSKQM